MASLLSLPPEILQNIFSQLNPFDRITVVKTFNHTLYDNALTALRPDLSWVEHRLYITSIFVDKRTARETSLLPSFPGYLPVFPYGSNDPELSTFYDCKMLDLDHAKTPYFRTSPPDLRWARLDGSLGWLVPLNKPLAAEMAGYNGWEGDEPLVEPAAADALIEQAKELELELPPGFETFIRSDRLHFRFASASAWFFRLGPLVKCPSIIDGDGKGYVLRFHCDQQATAFAFLYLRKGGQHCVFIHGYDVGSAAFDLRVISKAARKEYRSACEAEDKGKAAGGDDWSDEDEDEDEDLVAHTQVGYFRRAARAIRDGAIRKEELKEATAEQLQIAFNLEKDGCGLAALSFEEYLFTTYFEEQLYFLSTGEPSSGLKEYVARIYQSYIEAERLRHNLSVRKFLRKIDWQGKEVYDENHQDKEARKGPEVAQSDTDYSDSDMDSDMSSDKKGEAEGVRENEEDDGNYH